MCEAKTRRRGKGEGGRSRRRGAPRSWARRAGLRVGGGGDLSKRVELAEVGGERVRAWRRRGELARLREEERRDVHRDALLVEVHRQVGDDLCEHATRCVSGEGESGEEGLERTRGRATRVVLPVDDVERARNDGGELWRLGATSARVQGVSSARVRRQRARGREGDARLAQAELELVRPLGAHAHVLEDEDRLLRTLEVLDSSRRAHELADECAELLGDAVVGRGLSACRRGDLDRRDAVFLAQRARAEEVRQLDVAVDRQGRRGRTMARVRGGITAGKGRARRRRTCADLTGR